MGFDKIAEDGTSGDAAWTALVAAMNGPVNLHASVCWNAPGTTTVTTVTKDEPDEGEQPVVMTDKQPKQLSYHNWGVALSEVELDTLTGEVTILSTKMYYDCGKSLNPAIDIGQAEGAFVMGVGALLRENVLISKDGVLESDGTWEYKIPSNIDIPLDFEINFLDKAPFERGIMSSKAVGEPPLVLSGCSYEWTCEPAFALRERNVTSTI